MTEFKVGDIVEAFGCRGVVVALNESRSEPIVEFEGVFNVRKNFYRDGKYFEWAKEPSLKLISRPKKKVKKTVWVGVEKSFSYKDGITGSVFTDEKTARVCAWGYGVHPIEIEVDAEEYCMSDEGER